MSNTEQDGENNRQQLSLDVVKNYLALAKNAHLGLFFDKCYPNDLAIKESLFSIKELFYMAIIDSRIDVEANKSDDYLSKLSNFFKPIGRHGNPTRPPEIYYHFPLSPSVLQNIKPNSQKLNEQTLSDTTRKTLNDNARSRMGSLIKTLGGDTLELQCQWRFISGIGNAHPSEVGMLFHSTLGAPFLPGSAIKGIVRSYLEVLFAQGESDASMSTEELFLDSVFGTKDDTKTSKAGDYMFFDALPVGDVNYTIDVITPHQGQWYENGGGESHNKDNIANEWHDPKPIPFLSIDKPTFCFAIAPRPGTTINEGELGFLMTMLEHALSSQGAGAKSAVGYGYFVRPDATGNLS